VFGPVDAQRYRHVRLPLIMASVDTWHYKFTKRIRVHEDKNCCL
jgi:hypothetical protein